MAYNKLHVIGRSPSAVRTWAAENGIPLDRIEIIKHSDGLRTTSAGTIEVLTLAGALDDMPQVVASPIRTQLSIRRCLGNIIELQGTDVQLAAWRTGRQTGPGRHAATARKLNSPVVRVKVL